MLNRELNRQLQRLTWLFNNVPDAAKETFELQAHWGRYLCVLVAGFLENAITEVYSEFVYRVGSKPLANFISTTVARIQNPNSKRFIETAKSFRVEWGRDLEAFLSEDGRKEAIDGIMNLRHQIAHGQSAGITLARVADYLKKSVEVIEFIETQCGAK
ncbi:MAG: HEPN domain-containing protein [Thermoanaerobaculia bacterium]